MAGKKRSDRCLTRNAEGWRVRWGSSISGRDREILVGFARRRVAGAVCSAAKCNDVRYGGQEGLCVPVAVSATNRRRSKIPF